MKNLKTFEDYSDLDKQDKEKAKRNQISNFPHSSKEAAKKREEREKRARKEEDEDLILSLMKDKGWGDLSYNRIEDFKNSDYYKDPIDENEFVEQFDDYLSFDDAMDDEYLNNKSGERRDLPDMNYKPKNYQSLTDEDGMPW